VAADDPGGGYVKKQNSHHERVHYGGTEYVQYATSCWDGWLSCHYVAARTMSMIWWLLWKR
jgi:hypothetical protein